MVNISKITRKAIEYNNGDVRRINHFLKVYSLAKTIGELEELDKDTQEILEISAILHDIGIHESEKKYNSSAGNYQQIEGPPVAKQLLEALCTSKSVIDRVCYLIAHHHTYNNITEKDYQILVEADFLVNIYEDNMGQAQIQSIKEKIFKTKTGIQLVQNFFGV